MIIQAFFLSKDIFAKSLEIEIAGGKLAPVVFFEF